MAVDKQGLTEQPTGGTFLAAGESPVVIDEELRGSLQSISGGIPGGDSEQLTSISLQRAKVGMIVYVENDYTIFNPDSEVILGDAYYTYRVQGTEVNERDIFGRLEANNPENWSRVHFGASGMTGGSTAESEARQTADSELRTSLESEIEDRLIGDSELRTSLESEIEDRLIGDSELRTSLESEIEDRLIGDSELRTSLESEIEDRQIGDSELRTSLESEIEDRQIADSELGSSLESEVEDRQIGDSELRTSLESEIEDRQIADSELGSSLESEVEDRQIGDSELRTSLESEIEDRLIGDSELRTSLESEIEDRQIADSELGSALESEVEDRQIGDSELRTSLESEIEDRLIGDSELRAALESDIGNLATLDSEVVKTITVNGRARHFVPDPAGNLNLVIATSTDMALNDSDIHILFDNDGQIEFLTNDSESDVRPGAVIANIKPRAIIESDINLAFLRTILNSNESDVRVMADSELRTSLESEIEDRLIGDSELRVSLESEIEDRLIGDSELRTSLESEIEDRLIGDSELRTSLESEIEDRQIADSELGSALESEVEDRQIGDSELRTSLESEIEDRQIADSELRTSLESEIEDRLIGDSELRTSLESEIEDRQIGDSELRTSLESEIEDRQIADSELGSALESEVEDRQIGDSELRTSLESEIEDRQIGDSELRSALESEIQHRMESDSELNTRISNLDLEDLHDVTIMDSDRVNNYVLAWDSDLVNPDTTLGGWVARDPGAITEVHVKLTELDDVHSPDSDVKDGFVLAWDSDFDNLDGTMGAWVPVSVRTAVTSTQLGHLQGVDSDIDTEATTIANADSENVAIMARTIVEGSGGSATEWRTINLADVSPDNSRLIFTEPTGFTENYRDLTHFRENGESELIRNLIIQTAGSGLFRVELPNFSPGFSNTVYNFARESGTGTTPGWDTALLSFVVSGTNPVDFGSQFILGVNSIAATPSTSLDIWDDYSRTGGDVNQFVVNPETIGIARNNWTQTFNTNTLDGRVRPQTNLVLNNDDDAVGGSVSTTYDYIVVSGSTPSTYTGAGSTGNLSVSWPNAGTTIGYANISSRIFLDPVETLTFSGVASNVFIETTALSNVVTKATDSDSETITYSNADQDGLGATAGRNVNGTLTLSTPFYSESSALTQSITGHNLTRSTTLRRPTRVTGSQYSIVVTDSTSNPSVSFQFPSFYLFIPETGGGVTLPTLAEAEAVMRRNTNSNTASTGVFTTGTDLSRVITNPSADNTGRLWFGVQENRGVPTSFTTTTLNAPVNPTQRDLVFTTPGGNTTYKLFGINFGPGITQQVTFT